MSKDYYSVLGVDKKSGQDEIKKAFRKKAHQCHPDKDGGDEAKFKEINEAYQVLGNAEKRKQYDQFGSGFSGAGGQGGFGGGGFNWQDFARQGGAQSGGFGGFEDLGDIFGDFFGGGRQSSGSASAAQENRGEDIQVTMSIDFEEAVFGKEKIISLDKFDKCDKCHGKGHESDVKIVTCPECKGTGKIQEDQRTIFGVFRSTKVCPTCFGQGEKPEKYCSKCGGQGRFKTKKDIKIKIPAGISEGETIRVTGEGNIGKRNSVPGNLYVSFRVKEHLDFERHKFDIFSEVEIDFVSASLGDKVLVKTLDGEVSLKIPTGTESGEEFALKGKGVPVLGREGSRGSHYIKVRVKTPQKISRKAKKLLEELKSEL
jgi:molecular chaperone DnaJ